MVLIRLTNETGLDPFQAALSFADCATAGRVAISRGISVFDRVFNSAHEVAAGGISLRSLTAVILASFSPLGRHCSRLGWLVEILDRPAYLHASRRRQDWGGEGGTEGIIDRSINCLRPPTSLFL